MRNEEETMDKSKQRVLEIDWENAKSFFSGVFKTIGFFIAIWSLLYTKASFDLAVTAFNSQIYIQNERDLNEHISNIGGLALELEKDIELMNYFTENPNLLKEKHLFDRLVIKNIEDRISDGEISNRVLKSHLLSTYFIEAGINNLISYINSPELLENREKKEDLASQLIIKLHENGGFIANATETLSLVETYHECLIEQKNIEFCNDIQFIKIHT